MISFYSTYFLDHNATKRVCDENDGSLFLLDLAVNWPSSLKRRQSRLATHILTCSLVDQVADQLFGNIRHDGSTFVERRDRCTVSECHDTCSRNISRKTLHRPIVLCVQVGPCVLGMAREPVDCDDADGGVLEHGQALPRSYSLNESGAIVIGRMKDSESPSYDWWVRQQCRCIRVHGGG